jgi:PAS domain S-box-containing protein
MVKSRSNNSSESHFDLHELFFSKTHHNGVIISGNSVFARVSKYPIDQVIGRAHSLVRHPDMPRAVFKYMWFQILKGHPITAYVKNSASDGSYYWVLASVFPFNEDFVSIRIKPNSEILNTVIIPLYQELKKQEGTLALDGQVELLAEKIKALGFDTYEAFMCHALNTELKGIHTHINSAKTEVDMSDRDLSGLSENLVVLQTKMTQVYTELSAASEKIESLNNLFKALAKISESQALLPFNLTMASQKSGSTQKTMEVLATLFSDQQRSVQSFLEDYTEVITNTKKEKLDPIRFATNACYLQVSMISQFLNEIFNHDPSSGFQMKPKLAVQECRSLLRLTMQQFETTLSQISEMRLGFIKILSKSGEMETIIKTIMSVAQLGQVEIAQSENLKSSITPHLNTMKSFSKELEVKIRDVEQSLGDCSKIFDFVSKSILDGTKNCVKAGIFLDKCEAKLPQDKVDQNAQEVA